VTKRLQLLVTKLLPHRMLERMNILVKPFSPVTRLMEMAIP
jgi:hypothetical protein